ncbi:MAG: ferredoxin [Bacilli bacterium]
MKIEINSDACIGCGSCCAICDDIFEFDDEEGTAKVKEDADFESFEEEIKNAVDSCPTDAIIEEKEER